MTLRAISATSRWFRRERHPSVNPLDVSSSLLLVKVSFKSSSFLGARSSIPERNIHAMSADSFSKTYLPTAGIHKSGRSAVAARVALNARRSWSRVIWSPTDSFFFAFFFSTSSFTSVSVSSFGGRRRLNIVEESLQGVQGVLDDVVANDFSVFGEEEAQGVFDRVYGWRFRRCIGVVFFFFVFVFIGGFFLKIPMTVDRRCFCCYKRRLRPTS